MNYVIVDFEFNTAYRIDQKTKRLLKGNAHPQCPQEIIEIGAVRLDESNTIVDTFQTMVKPRLYHRMHPKIRQKTRITCDQLALGVPFGEAITAFREWVGTQSITLGSWGQDDHNELLRNCIFHQLDLNWYENHLDVQQLCMRHLGMKKGNQIGLKKAVEHFGIKVEHTFHQALHDAIYTAHVFRALQEADQDANTPAI